MTDNRGTNDMSNQNSCYESYGEYLRRAAQACEAGDMLLGMHLYLAAYERAVADPDIPDGMALAGLREAWNLACDLKERSMAEYVFEKLEPFLTGEEIAACANELQNLALDRLEAYGISREDLRDMAQMISQDFVVGDGSIVKVESIAISAAAADMTAEGGESGESEQAPEAPDAVDAPEATEATEALEAPETPAASEQAQEEPLPAPPFGAKRESGAPRANMNSAPADFNPYDMYNTSSIGTSYHAATNEGAGSYTFTRDKDRAAESERLRAQQEAAAAESSAEEHADAAQDASAQGDSDQASAKGKPDQALAKGEPGQASAPASAPGVSLPANQVPLPPTPQVPLPGAHALNYGNLAGYGEAIAAVRELGVGLERDKGFQNFIGMMNSRHGLDRMPALDTLLFRASVVEDATRFVDATIGEIGLPVLRMSMEEGFQGAPVLCVTTFGDSRPRMNHTHNRFDGPAILVLDDLDTWSLPQTPENAEGLMGLVMANMSRGAREAINMIRSAVEDPDVYVLATASFTGDVDPFFYEMLEPLTIIEIALPSEEERDEIWREIMHDHPSTRPLDRKALVRFSAGIPRYDMYMAARAALEDAYKAGLVQRTYLPVTPQNIYDKLAACLPLDSDEYQAIEDEVVRSFRGELDDFDSLLDELPE